MRFQIPHRRCRGALFTMGTFFDLLAIPYPLYETLFKEYCTTNAGTLGDGEDKRPTTVFFLRRRRHGENRRAAPISGRRSICTRWQQHGASTAGITASAPEISGGRYPPGAWRIFFWSFRSKAHTTSTLSRRGITCPGYARHSIWPGPGCISRWYTIPAAMKRPRPWPPCAAMWTSGWRTSNTARRSFPPNIQTRRTISRLPAPP